MKRLTPFLLCCLALLFLLQAYSQEKKICITVDDLPTVSYGIPGIEFQQDLTQALVQIFIDNQIPAIGFVNERKLYAEGILDSNQVKLLTLWLESGLELGNHTYSHLNYHKVSFEQYTKDILKGEAIIKELGKAYDQEITYFRHPYLRSGLRQSHTDSLRVFLEENGYVESPVTIDNDDYLFAFAYSRAYKRGDQALMEKIGRDYVQYMEQKLVYFEGQSQKLFDRNMAHILLIHANLLNSEYLDELVDVYKDRGYSFVSQTEVLEDPAYAEPVTKFGDWGISWLDRWALSRGYKGEFFQEDPPTPEYIKELAK
ncbi:MAG: polysaccharide deacetylase family protein [Bacteroidota bacterium]